MPSFTQEHYYEFSVKQIYDIVVAVQHYPEFLPWCKEAEIISNSDGILIAKLRIEFKGISQEYTSEVRYQYENNHAKIDVKAIDGPFNHLVNLWEIEDYDGVTKVKFHVDFEFKLSLLDKLIKAVFSIAYEKMLAAFERRADELYIIEKE